MHRDMAKPLADDAVEPQIVVLLHQPVPAPVLPVRPHVGRTVTARRSMDESRAGSVTMAATLPHRKRNDQPRDHLTPLAGRTKNEP